MRGHTLAGPSITGITRMRSLDHRNNRVRATRIWQRSYRWDGSYRSMPKSLSRLAAGVRKSGSRPVGAQSSWARWWAGRSIQSLVR